VLTITTARKTFYFALKSLLLLDKKEVFYQ